MKRHHSPVLVMLVCACLFVTPRPVHAQQKLADELIIYNWEEYISPAVLKNFQKEFGVKVIVKTFKDEEEMLSTVESAPDQYDIIVASASLIQEMIQQRLLYELDRDNIPNIVNIERSFLRSQNDPGNRFSIPYLWGTTGILVNRNHIKEEPKSWSILFNPAYKGKLAMLNNIDEVAGATLKLLGYSINTKDPKYLEQTRQKILEQADLIQGYLDIGTIVKKVASGELWAAQAYSGDALRAVDANPNVEYIIPEEGGLLWVDSLSIPRDAPHPYTAEVFINYILDPKVSGMNANYTWGGNCNIAARPYTLKEILKHPAVYPAPEVLKRCEKWVNDATAEGADRTAQFYNKLMAEMQLKAQ